MCSDFLFPVPLPTDDPAGRWDDRFWGVGITSGQGLGFRVQGPLVRIQGIRLKLPD